ncbi:MAG: fimbrillin family protein [Rikenellaceae bacterium]|nr:fimbrillin family protein [Rikenellaceae bacterium]
MATRATIYDNEKFLTEEDNGGNFSIFAFPSGTQTKYLNDARVSYFADGHKWLFRQGNTGYSVYWPHNIELDFFAYAPWSNKLNTTCFTLGDFAPTTGPSFSCDLPLSNVGGTINQDNLQEFVYAYSPGKSYQDQVDNGNAIALKFVRPLAVVYFKLERSYRMTMDNITISSIYNQGDYSSNGDTSAAGFEFGEWTPKGSKQNFVIEINKAVPDPINYNTIFAGPLLVMPQSLSGVTMTLNNKRTDNSDYTKVINFDALTNDEWKKWEAGHKYTYSLYLDDNDEEILFNVLVEEWKKVDYKHNIDVE